MPGFCTGLACPEEGQAPESARQTAPRSLVGLQSGTQSLHHCHTTTDHFYNAVLHFKKKQMSFWGATVITSLASAIPLVGDSIVKCPNGLDKWTTHINQGLC